MAGEGVTVSAWNGETDEHHSKPRHTRFGLTNSSGDVEPLP